MAHLVGTFFGISGLVTDVQGKHIALVGGRSSGRYPVPFILPPQNAWIWTKAKYLHDTTRFRNSIVMKTTTISYGSQEQAWPSSLKPRSHTY
jgi:hypothetical protein